MGEAGQALSIIRATTFIIIPTRAPSYWNSAHNPSGEGALQQKSQWSPWRPGTAKGIGPAGWKGSQLEPKKMAARYHHSDRPAPMVRKVHDIVGMSYLETWISWRRSLRLISQIRESIALFSLMADFDGMMPRRQDTHPPKF
jgi:hypothetical protein